MDDLVYEEFKGTGNMELHLDRRLAERRIYPAIDVMRSGTRRDDLLFDSMEYQSIILMRRMLDMLGDNERTEVLIGRLARTKSNKEFLASLKDGGWGGEFSVIGYQFYVIGCGIDIEKPPWRAVNNESKLVGFVGNVFDENVGIGLDGR